MIEWFIIITTVFFLTIFAYIKIKYPFWSSQPVYHSYDYLSQLCSHPYKLKIIKNKYYDPIQYKTSKYEDVNNDEIAKFLQSHYTDHDNVLYKVDKNILDIIYKNPKSFITLYKLQEFFYKDRELKINQFDNILGIAGSIPVNIYVKLKNKTLKEGCFVLQHICSSRYENEKRNIIHQKLLQNHIFNYNQTTGEPIHIIIKCGSPFNGVVPLINSFQSSYVIKSYKLSIDMPLGYNIILCKNENLQDVMTLFTVENPLFDVMTLFDRYSLISQIENNNLNLYLLYYKSKLKAVYVIKPEHMFYEDYDGYSCIMTSSVCLCELDIFKMGFEYLVNELSKKNMNILKINEVANNFSLLNIIPIHQRVTYYVYLHNYIIPNSTIENYNYFSLF